MFGRFVCLLGVLIVLGSVDRAAAKDPPPSLSNIHVIGVTSSLGTQAEIKTIGITAFGNKLTYLPIVDWGLDDLAVREIEGALGARFTVKSTPIDPSLLARVHSSLFKSQAKSLEEAMHAAPPNDVDAYLVLLPDEQFLPYPSNQSIFGAGAYRQNWGQGHHTGEGIVYLAYSLYLIDAKTGRTMMGQTAGPIFEEKRSFSDELLVMPHSLLCPHFYTNDADWPETAEQLSDGQKQTLRYDLASLIIGSLPQILGKMKLADDMSSKADANAESK